MINGLGSGGAETMLFRLLQRINRSYFSPEVVTLLKLEGPLSARIEELGIPVVCVEMKNKLDLCSIVRVYNYLKNSKPDVLHTQLFAADIIGRVSGKLLKVPIIVTSIRNSNYGGRHRDLLIKWTENFTEKTTIVSNHAAQRFINDNIIPKSKLKVIHSGINPDCFYRESNLGKSKALKETYSIPEGYFFLLAVGSLSAQKGYPVLLDALKILKEQGFKFKLIVAGEGSLKDALQVQANDNGLSGAVKFIGRSDNVSELMSVADALVLSSRWEGLPGVVMEAMAANLPVVATKVGGTSEIVVDGVTGFLVQPNDSLDFAATLEKLIEMTEKEREIMGKAGRLRIEKEFHLDKMVYMYEKLYRDSLRSKGIIGNTL